MARILIVDDDFEMIGILTQILTHDGHVVESAGDPAAGMKKTREFGPELIILDYHMPGDTGAHLFESLRRNNSTKATPVLFMSGEASPEQILSEISDVEGSKFLPKGSPLAELREALKELLEWKRAG